MWKWSSMKKMPADSKMRKELDYARDLRVNSCQGMVDGVLFDSMP